MVQTVPDILARIVAEKRDALTDLRARTADWKLRAAKRTPQRRDFRAALNASRPAIIAEVKKASPSRGILSPDFHPADIARSYETGGAAAISVLTDEKHFQGSLADLEAARDATRLPVLRKDFTVDEIHVIEAAAHGADAILLIAAILSSSEMKSFRELAAEYRIAALVEVHDERELESALHSGAEIIGVNNRNLHNFEVSRDTSLRLADKIPGTVLRVSESGIHSAADIRVLQDAGYHAFLVGEHLMKSGNPAGTLRALAS